VTTPLSLQSAHNHSDQTNTADAVEHSGFHLLRAGAANAAGVAGVGEASEVLALSLLSVQQRSSAAGQIFLALLSPSQKTFAASHESNGEPTGNSAGGVRIYNAPRLATFVPKLNLQHLCDSQEDSLSEKTALHPIEEGHDLEKEEWEEELEEEAREALSRTSLAGLWLICLSIRLFVHVLVCVLCVCLRMMLDCGQIGGR